MRISLAVKGWLYRGKTTHNANASSVCTEQSVANCEYLKRVGISALVMMVLFLFVLVLTLIPCAVKPNGEGLTGNID